MNKESSDYNVTIKASCRRELETQLDKAVEEGIAAALKCSSQGLVVTRHDYTTFGVELSHNVPFGVTVERDRLTGHVDSGLPLGTPRPAVRSGAVGFTREGG